MSWARAILIAAVWLGGQPALAEPAPPLDEAALAGQRGGLATPMGIDVGFGASVRTYLDGSLALETRLTWTEQGVQTERVFETDQAKAASAGGRAPTANPVLIAPGASVLHDLTENRIASVVLNTGNDRTIRQETDVTLTLPQLPDLQQRIASERLGQALQALSPQASGIGK
jgi:hypothetical protein